MLNEIDMGYESNFGYAITREQRESGWIFHLSLVNLDPPFSREYDWDWTLEDETMENAREGLVWIAQEGKHVVGMIEGCQLSESDLEIKSLFVSRQHRRRGIGKRLVDVLTQVGKERGTERILVTTQATDGQAVQFYVAQGFELIGLNCDPDSAADLENGEAVLFLQRLL